MIRVSIPRYIWVAALALASVATAALTLSGPASLLTGIVGYLLLALLPGAGIYLSVARDPRRLELALSALAVSPVLTAVIAIFAMLLGVSVATAGAWLLLLAGVLCAVALLRSPAVASELDRSQTALLVGTILLICVVIGYLPMSSDWWRTRADAVFHAAVIAQIRDFGIPPEDPYFIGFPLQYMWFYHVQVILMSEVTRFSPYVVMALLNIQALCTLALAAFLLSNILTKGFRHGYAACLTALFGLNALFWVFLPIKALRAFTGDVRGVSELATLFALRPYDMFTVSKFLYISMNMEFLLDKFMVATATSVGLGLMGTAWYGCSAYIKEGRRGALIVAFFSSVGMMAFHTAIGVLSYGALAGALVLLVLLRSRLQTFRWRRVLTLGACLILAFLVIWPYLHTITQAKRGEQLMPFSLSFFKMVGIFISCGMGIFLSAFQVRQLLRRNDGAGWYVISATLGIILICTVIELPGTNTANKLPLLVFFPLAVIGGWTLADWASRARGLGRQRAAFAVGLVLAFAPLNVLALGAYYHTTPDPHRSNPFAAMNAREREVAEWVKDNTPRGAIFFDSGDRVFLIANGPRRYYLGNSIYAEGWGYEESEIAKRKAVIDNLYSDKALTPKTLEVLGSLPEDVYVIVRDDESAIHGDKFERQPSLFLKAFVGNGIAVFRINRDAARGVASYD